jgi:predicted RNA-binding Zn-ribbon protein involved in translation (DUF1610 family)
MKLNDLAEHEKKHAILDSKNRVLCINCNKELAPDNEYGIIKRCIKCEKNKESYNVVVMMDEPGGRKSY